MTLYWIHWPHGNRKVPDSRENIKSKISKMINNGLDVFLNTEEGANWVNSKVPNSQYSLDLARNGDYRIEIVRKDNLRYHLNRAEILSIAAKTVGLIGLGSSGIVAVVSKSQAGLFTAVGISAATGITSLVLAFSSDANLKKASKSKNR